MRKILCNDCGKLKPTPSDDAARGLFERRVLGTLYVHCQCDLCSEPLKPGDYVVAISVPKDIKVWEEGYLDTT